MVIASALTIWTQVALGSALATDDDTVGLVQMTVDSLGALHQESIHVANWTGQKRTGIMTMWTTNSATSGAHCEYGKNGLTGAHLPRHIKTGYQCAIGNEFGKGEHCGKCYRVTATSNTGNGGTPGNMGSAEVMVTDSGAGGPDHFDCVMDSFQEITGATTGIFPIEFEETRCTNIQGNPVISNWADQNAYYCKMMFHNIGGWGGLHSVRACLGNNCQNLNLFSGATWIGCPQGTGDTITFTLKQKHPRENTYEEIACECNKQWPWAQYAQCTCPRNFGGSGSDSSPTPTPVPTPTPAPQPTPVPTPQPTQGGQCASIGNDCRSSGCCQDSTLTCYRKDEYWASCRSFCEEGQPNPYDAPEFQTPWDCTIIGGSGPATPTPPVPPPPAPTPPTSTGNCAKTWDQCGGEGWTGPTCCESGSMCNVGNPWYSQCQP